MQTFTHCDEFQDIGKITIDPRLGLKYNEIEEAVKYSRVKIKNTDFLGTAGSNKI